MANHNIAARVVALLNGFFGLFVRRIEVRHPEIAYLNNIQSLKEKYIRLKGGAGRVIARRNSLRNEKEQVESELLTIGHQLAAAAATEQDDLGVILIKKKQTLQQALDALVPQLKVAEKDAEQIKADLVDLKGQIANAESEKDRMLAMFESAEARIQIQETLSGLSVDAEVQALAAVRQHITGRVAEADLGAELRENDLDVQLKKLGVAGADASARSEFQKYKAAQRAADGAGAAAKTL